MSSTQTSRADSPQRADSKVERWKSMVSVGTLVAMAPVIALVAVLLIGSVLPIVVLGMVGTLVVGPHGRAQASRTPLGPHGTLQTPRTLAAPTTA